MVSNEEHVTFVTISVPRLRNLQKLIPAVLPSVDRVIVVIGVKEEESISYLKSLGEKVTVIYNEWPGDFTPQFNIYLPHITGGWVLVCDDDEIPSPEMLQILKPLIRESTSGHRFDVVEFRCEMVGHGYSEIHNRSDEDEVYYREIFFRWNPSLYYDTEAHQALRGLKGPKVRREECYFHIKDETDLFRNACRQYFVAGRWDDNEGKNPITKGVREADWHELHDILRRNHPETSGFPHLHRLMIEGTICQEFRDWAEKYKDNDLPAGGELRSFYKYQQYLDENHKLRGKPVLE